MVITQPPSNIIRGFQTSIPKERMQNFRRAVQGNEARAVELYILDSELASRIHGLFRHVEITLRESMHRQLTHLLGPKWYASDSWLKDSLFAEQLNTTLKSVRIAKGNAALTFEQIPAGDIIAGLNLGAWINLLSQGDYDNGVPVRYEQNLWIPDNGLHAAFQARTGFDTSPSRNNVHQLAQRFNWARNRINHCEPVVFGFPQTGVMKGPNKLPLRRSAHGIVEDICKLFGYLYPQQEHWLRDNSDLNALLKNPLLARSENYIKGTKRYYWSAPT